MIQLNVLGTQKLLAKLNEVAKKSHDDLLKAVRKGALRVDRAAKHALSGNKLKVRSGTLRSSLRVEIDATHLEGRVGTNVAYGPIQEYGGQTPPHIILPRNKKALRFPIGGGGFAFAKSVNHPGSTIKATHWLSDAYKGEQDAIADEFKAALNRTLTP